MPTLRKHPEITSRFSAGISPESAPKTGTYFGMRPKGVPEFKISPKISKSLGNPPNFGRFIFWVVPRLSVGDETRPKI
jgi:hypothetical protein